MVLDTVDALRTDALFRASEPTDSTSDFWSKSLEYLNRVQLQLLLGGRIAVGRDLAESAGIYAHVVNLPVTDWWWARKQPRGVINTDAAIETGTVTATKDSSTITFSSAPAQSVEGWRIQINHRDTVPVIQQHTAGSATATLDAPWPEDTQTTVTFSVFNLEYDLPTDFLRFAGEPYLHSHYMDSIPVRTTEDHDTIYPLATLFKEAPTSAAYVSPTRIRLNAFDTRSYRLEFDYIMRPADLQAGGPVILPPHHRMVLAVGAAMLIAFDKGDARTQELASEFRETVAAMAQEQRRMLTGGSRVMGQHLTRLGQTSHRGRIQPKGEVFVI